MITIYSSSIIIQIVQLIAKNRIEEVFNMNMKTFEMREKRLAELLGAKVLWEFISAVTEEIEKQELGSTPGLLEDLFIHVKETIQIQNMNQHITKAPVKTEAGSIDKETLYIEAYVFHSFHRSYTVFLGFFEKFYLYKQQ